MYMEQVTINNTVECQYFWKLTISRKQQERKNYCYVGQYALGLYSMHNIQSKLFYLLVLRFIKISFWLEFNLLFNNSNRRRFTGLTSLIFYVSKWWFTKIILTKSYSIYMWVSVTLFIEKITKHSAWLVILRNQLLNFCSQITSPDTGDPICVINCPTLTPVVQLLKSTIRLSPQSSNCWYQLSSSHISFPTLAINYPALTPVIQLLKSTTQLSSQLSNS